MPVHQTGDGRQRRDLLRRWLQVRRRAFGEHVDDLVSNIGNGRDRRRRRVLDSRMEVREQIARLVETTMPDNAVIEEILGTGTVGENGRRG